MAERTLLDSESSASQSTDAVVELLHCLGRPADPLPAIVDHGKVKLVKSNKGDVFYCMTAKACSCPNAIYRPGDPCKHQRKYFPGRKKSRSEIKSETDTEIASSGRARWVGGFNGPVDPETIQSKKRAHFGKHN